MRCLLLPVALVVSACTPWLEAPDLAPGDVEAPIAGRYAGTAFLEVRAFAGPAQVAREICSTPIEVVVDPASDVLVRGSFSCVFSRGEAFADLEGFDAGLPLVEGELISSELEADFTGFFVEDDRLYIEIEGTQPAEGGIRLKYLGYVDSDRFAPLAGGSIGG